MQVKEIFDLVRGYFPGANVFASTFDDFTNQLVAMKDQLDFPVVYGEVGDTWIQGEQPAPRSSSLTQTC